MSCNGSTYWLDRLATVRALIEAYDAALLALGTDGVQSYSLDTGQTRVVKTKFDISSLKNTRNSLLNELAVLEARVGCAPGVTYAGPSF
jgi:hypothetical protein